MEIFLEGENFLHLKVALVRVENDGLLSVEFPHHFHCESSDGGLEVRLLCVNHDTHVTFLPILQQKTTHTATKKNPILQQK